MNICPCNLATCIRGATSKPANTANGEKDLLESLRVASGLALALEGVRVLDEMNADGPSSKPMTRSMRTGATFTRSRRGGAYRGLGNRPLCHFDAALTL